MSSLSEEHACTFPTNTLNFDFSLMNSRPNTSPQTPFHFQHLLEVQVKLKASSFKFKSSSSSFLSSSTVPSPCLFKDMDMDLDFEVLEVGMDAEAQPETGPAVDPFEGHPYLTFPARSEARRKCAKLCTMQVGGHCHIDWDFLESVDEAPRARDIIGIEGPWSRLFQGTAEDTFREFTVEFISSFTYAPRPEGYVEDPAHPYHEIRAEINNYPRMI